MKSLPKKLLPLTLFGIAVTSLFSVQPAQAYTVTLEQVGSNVIDQNQPSAAAFLAGFAQPDLAQSFKRQMPTSLEQAFSSAFCRHVGHREHYAVGNALPQCAGGMGLAGASAVGTAGNWVDVFWNPIAITPSTTYFLVFTGDTSLGIAGDVNPYPNGQAYANAGFQPFPIFDYTFLNLLR